MPNLVYTVAAYVPFTKILSANINQDKTDIQSRLNWDGTVNTGLGDSNIQSNTVSGGGLTRSTKLKKGTANAFISNDAAGAIQDITSAANQTLYTDGSGIPTAGALSIGAGGTGASLTIGTPNQVLAVNAGATALSFQDTPPSPALKPYTFYNFS